VVLQWPNELIAVALPGSPRELIDRWEDRGYDVVRFAPDVSTWSVSFRKLGRLLGVSPAGNASIAQTGETSS
jgi:hypothetical protein